MKKEIKKKPISKANVVRNGKHGAEVKHAIATATNHETKNGTNHETKNGKATKHEKQPGIETPVGKKEENNINSAVALLKRENANVKTN
jgi:hypothetical protein